MRTPRTPLIERVMAPIGFLIWAIVVALGHTTAFFWRLWMWINARHD